LRDARALDSPLGRWAMATGAAGEIAPIVAMSIVLSQRHEAAVQTLFTGAFLLATAIVGWAVITAHTPRVLGFLRRAMARSGQLPIRMGVLLVIGMAVLAEAFAVDAALGGLASGLMLGLALRGADSHVLHHKLDAIGFGL